MLHFLGRCILRIWLILFNWYLLSYHPSVTPWPTIMDDAIADIESHWNLKDMWIKIRMPCQGPDHIFVFIFLMLWKHIIYLNSEIASVQWFCECLTSLLAHRYLSNRIVNYIMNHFPEILPRSRRCSARCFERVAWRHQNGKERCSWRRDSGRSNWGRNGSPK